MADEVLRMRATVVTDEALVALRGLGKELGLVGRNVNTSVARREVTQLQATFSSVTRELRNNLVPVLSSFGFATGGVGIAMVSMATATKNYAEKINELGRQSRTLGISARDIRAFTLAGERFGLTADQTGTALQTLAKNFYDFKRNLDVNGVADQLRQMGQGDLLAGIKQAATASEAIGLIAQRMEFLNKVDPERAKRLAEALYGIGAAANITAVEIEKAKNKVNELTEEQKKAADRFNEAFTGMTNAWDKFANQALQSSMPGLSAAMGMLEKLFGLMDRISKTPSVIGGDGKVTPLPGYEPQKQEEFGRRPVPRLPMSFDGGADTGGGAKEIMKEAVFEGLVKFAQVQAGGGAGGFQNAAFSGGSGGGGGLAGAFPGTADYPNLGGGGGAHGGGTPGTPAGKAGIIPQSIPGVGGAVPSMGSALGGSDFLKEQRARLGEEMQRNPELKRRFAALIDLENPGAGTAVAESAMNRAAMTGRSLESILSGGPKSFYGPARRGMVEPRMRAMSQKTLAARYAQIDAALEGSNQIKGHTDQGSAGDPNYHRGGIGVNINRERFNDWGGYKGVEFSRRWREAQQRQVAEGARNSKAAEDIDFEQGGFSRRQLGGFTRKPPDVNSTPAPPFGDRGRLLDNVVGGGQQQAVTAKGIVNINVTGQAKAEAKTSGDLFQETTISNYKQMTPTSLGGGGHPDGGY